MLDRTDQHALLKADRRNASGYALALAFFGAVGIVMTAWIAAIVWVSWHLIAWIFQ
ncbi:MAG: hypothetical protein ACOY3N_14315 [Bradyrhizobium sp.]|jgi:hypothetical protein|uniref:hypothetical protein n=1 Tax=Bradyrhizobium TaxID=374 RepID=UPI000407758E|nr:MULTISPECIES: hypothetical protein [Bradyrhizobium]